MGILKKQWKQIALMAFPGMILASVVTGLLVWSSSPEWSFWVCWLIGVITAATDPVAVVALLSEMGASKTLGTLIEGESLLNDGSAVVLYVFVRNAIGYTTDTNPPPWMASADSEGNSLIPSVGYEFLRIVAQMLVFGTAGASFWPAGPRADPRDSPLRRSTLWADDGHRDAGPARRRVQRPQD